MEGGQLRQNVVFCAPARLTRSNLLTPPWTQASPLARFAVRRPGSFPLRPQACEKFGLYYRRTAADWLAGFNPSPAQGGLIHPLPGYNLGLATPSLWL